MNPFYQNVIVGSGLLVVSLWGGWGCTTTLRTPDPGATSLRTTQEEFSDPLLGAPLVTDFRSVCDSIARDLVRSRVVQEATRPLVLEVQPVENATGLQSIDTAIYAETIRSKIIESGCRNIVFRDEHAQEQVLNERIQQAPGMYTVDSSKTQTKVRRRRDGPPRPGQLLEDENWSTSNTFSRTTSVSSAVADVDFLLNGKIYAQNERRASGGNVGYRYYLFQFRLTDARNRLIVWEKAYDVKREGVLGQ